jgi:hypothetical protein
VIRKKKRGNKLEKREMVNKKSILKETRNEEKGETKKKKKKKEESRNGKINKNEMRKN